MHLNALYLLLLFGGIFTIAAAIRGTKTALKLLIPAGVIFMVISVPIFQEGLPVVDGKTITEENETSTGGDSYTLINETVEYEQPFSKSVSQGIAFTILFTGIFLILLGSSGGFA